MKFFLAVFSALLFLTDLSAQPAHRYWIFLRDKGPVQGELSPAVSEFALAKRQRKNIPTGDFTDLPVYSGYTAILKQTGIRIHHRSRWFNAVSADLSGIPASTIRALPFVRDIQPVRVLRSSGEVRPAPSVLFKPSDDFYGPSDNQARMIGIPELHDQGFYGQGVRIALFDTGFRLEHDALQHITVVAAYDFINNDKVVDNQAGDSPAQYEHGTRVLSVIGGYSPGNLVGPAWKSEYLLAKTENIASETHMEEDNWVAAAEWADSLGADSLGADIISSSLGYSTFDKGQVSYTYEDMDGKTTIITRAANMAVEKGISVFNSAGNEGSLSWHYITAPADGFNVIAVGGLNPDGSLWNGSSRGPTYDGRIKPDVVAQGGSVYNVSPATTDRYETATGTSLSCPLAAGSGAIILSVNPNLTPLELRDLMIRSATHYLEPDNDTGYGTIDLVTLSGSR